MEILLSLRELPPPISECYKNVRNHGRAKTPRYKAWSAAAAYELRSQAKGHGLKAPIATPVRVSYRLVRPSARRMDLANREKGLSDALVAAGILADDSLIHELFMYWARGGAPVGIFINPQLEGRAE